MVTNPEEATRLIGRMSRASTKATHAQGNSKAANMEELRAAIAIFQALVGRKPTTEEREKLWNVTSS